MVTQIGRARAPAYQLRLEHLVNEPAPLWGVCTFCRHQSRLELSALLKQYTIHTRLVYLENRLRCEKCGAHGKGACAFLIEWPN